MKIWRTQRNETGDTLIEVMIAVVIVTSILVGAFVITQKSAQAVRDSQEHGEMQQILHGQIELVRELATTQYASGQIYNHPEKYFCMDPGSTPSNPSLVPLNSLGLGNLPPLDTDDFNTNYGTGVCHNIQQFYNVSITYDSPSRLFIFTGRWDRLGGGRNEEVMVYRAYPALPPPPPLPAPPPPSDPAPSGTCESLSTDSGVVYFDLWNYASSDWHVSYTAGHPISKQYFGLDTQAMTPGDYTVWGVAKDNSYNPVTTADNKSLHYLGYTSSTSTTPVFQTGDSPTLPSTKAVGKTKFPEATWTSTIHISSTVKFLRVEHASQKPSTDDSVDSACFAYKKID